jgi:hypothetical protein
MQATEHLVKRAGLILLCQSNVLMMAHRYRNMYELQAFYSSVCVSLSV